MKDEKRHALEREKRQKVKNDFSDFHRIKERFERIALTLQQKSYPFYNRVQKAD